MFYKKLLWKISKSSQESICNEALFSLKLQAYALFYISRTLDSDIFRR